MRKIESYEQTQNFVRQIRELRQGFVTNFYWDDNKHPYWIADGSFEFEQSVDCILMEHRCKEFTNIFYIATSFAAFGELLEVLHPEGPLVVDVVCKGEGNIEQEAFANLGFVKYQHLYRMSHVGNIVGTDWMQDPRVKYGEKADTSLVYSAMQKDFDPLAEQLPSIKELEDYAERKQLLVIKDGDKLCGFLIFEITGVTWYLRYWYTSPDYRNQGVGAGLLRTSLLYGANSKRQIFWVIADNENAIKRYEHYGFTRENMNDYVMIKR
jgi:ribosomal protein S18 acetylase RimI-like enzyme